MKRPLGLDHDVHGDGEQGKSGSEARPSKLVRRGYEEVQTNSDPEEDVRRRWNFDRALSSHSWDVAESYIHDASVHRLNEGLCVALDSIWFMSSEDELSAAVKFIEKIIQAGATEYNRATLRTAFLASCVSACRSRTRSMTDTVQVMAARLHDRLNECSGDQELKNEAAWKVQRFTVWALECMGSHSRARSLRGEECKVVIRSSVYESQLQLMAFKRFLHLAKDKLTGKDYTEAFDAACFPLTLFSSSIDPGWAAGIAASAVEGLLRLLAAGGADNVNRCFLEAARFGSTELVHILLQIARTNGYELDVELALGFASHYSKIGAMNCLVAEGGASAFLGPLMRAAERGSLEVVEWFIARGCKDMELCLALTAAASSSKLEAAKLLLEHVPSNVIQPLSTEIIKAAGERSSGCFRGISFLLQSDFAGSPEMTYKAADEIAREEDEGSAPAELREFLRAEWSQQAFEAGREAGVQHYVNFLRALKRGCSPLRLRALPHQLQAAVAYLPLFKECASYAGVLLPQRLSGQLVEAASRVAGIGDAQLLRMSKAELMRAVGGRLPPYFHCDAPPDF